MMINKNPSSHALYQKHFVGSKNNIVFTTGLSFPGKKGSLELLFNSLRISSVGSYLSITKMQRL